MNPTPTDTQAAQQRVLSIWEKAKQPARPLESQVCKLSPCPTTAPGTSPAKPKEVIHLHLPGRKKAE